MKSIWMFKSVRRTAEDIVAVFRACDYRTGYGSDELDLLTTCIHHWELEVIVTLLLIPTLQITPRSLLSLLLSLVVA
jgi:hypothetical protein